MAGSPKKRARKKARELALAQGPGSLPQPETAAPAGTEAPASRADGATTSASPAPGLPALVTDAEFAENSLAVAPEVLSPVVEAEPTRTTLKRAMRRKAEAYVDEAIERLAKAMRNPDDRVGAPAAEKILDRALGKPTPEIEAGDGGLSVVILRFGEQA